MDRNALVRANHIGGSELLGNSRREQIASSGKRSIAAPLQMAGPSLPGDPGADSTSSAPRSSRPPRRSKAARADRPELTKMLAQTSSLKTEFLAPGKRAAFRCGAG